MERRIIRGYGSRQVPCGEPWTVKVRNEDFRFAAGTLLVRAVVSWCSDFGCEVGRARRAVRLH
jgi:hypothetical protein